MAVNEAVGVVEEDRYVVEGAIDQWLKSGEAKPVVVKRSDGSQHVVGAIFASAIAMKETDPDFVAVRSDGTEVVTLKVPLKGQSPSERPGYGAAYRTLAHDM